MAKIVGSLHELALNEVMKDMQTTPKQQIQTTVVQYHFIEQWNIEYLVNRGFSSFLSCETVLISIARNANLATRRITTFTLQDRVCDVSVLMVKMKMSYMLTVVTHSMMVREEY